MDRHHFFKEIQCGQGICINFTVGFYKGLGNDFGFVLHFTSVFFLLHISQFCSYSISLLGEDLSPREHLGFLLEWDMKTQGGLWATSLPDAETAGFLGGLVLALGPRMGSEAKNHLEKGD